jgi:hypothetical protein
VHRNDDTTGPTDRVVRAAENKTHVSVRLRPHSKRAGSGTRRRRRRAGGVPARGSRHPWKTADGQRQMKPSGVRPRPLWRYHGSLRDSGLIPKQPRPRGRRRCRGGGGDGAGCERRVPDRRPGAHRSSIDQCSQPVRQDQSTCVCAGPHSSATSLATSTLAAAPSTVVKPTR